MPVLRLRPNRVQYTCDGRFVFIQLLADGKTKINGTQIHPDDLKPRIGATMESRAERVVYLVPDDAILYGRFVATFEQLSGAASDMHVAVLSGNLRDEYFKQHLEPCDLVWPN
jgi:biopolymer transport protein ExbD